MIGSLANCFVFLTTRGSLRCLIFFLGDLFLHFKCIEGPTLQFHALQYIFFRGLKLMWSFSGAVVVYTNITTLSFYV